MIIVAVAILALGLCWLVLMVLLHVLVKHRVALTRDEGVDPERALVDQYQLERQVASLWPVALPLVAIAILMLVVASG